jgi:hypothetical protein
MKKILITVTILLLIASAISYAGVFKQPESGTAGTNSSLFENTVSTVETTPANSGGFFRSGNPDDPGGRPGDGGGIGQDTPLNDGLFVLVTCCIFYGTVILYRGKKEIIVE